MFELFERFVFCVFHEAAHRRFGVHVEKAKFPLDTERRVGIHPDVLIRGRSFVTVGDAKYKVTKDDAGRHPDLYQVVAYSTALGLLEATHRPQALLIYPATERTPELEGELHILTSTSVVSHK
jgi:5-methylcytosine-specific restriction endonuclease McrBC regulatory subunit McrC